MLRTVEAVIEEDGQVRLLETISVSGPRRALVTVLDEPAVVLRTAWQDSRVVISVSDRGVGIPPEDLPHVFDPYYTTRRSGTGLGLPIAKNIVEGLGGTIAVTSRQTEGTTVRIELPARAGTTA